MWEKVRQDAAWKVEVGQFFRVDLHKIYLVMRFCYRRKRLSLRREKLFLCLTQALPYFPFMIK